MLECGLLLVLKVFKIIRIDLKLSTFQYQTKNARQRSASN